jgi:hypothetical protein
LPFGNLKVAGNVVVPVPPFAVKQSDEVTALGDHWQEQVGFRRGRRLHHGQLQGRP